MRYATCDAITAGADGGQFADASPEMSRVQYVRRHGDLMSREACYDYSQQQ